MLLAALPPLIESTNAWIVFLVSAIGFAILVFRSLAYIVRTVDKIELLSASVDKKTEGLDAASVSNLIMEVREHLDTHIKDHDHVHADLARDIQKIKDQLKGALNEPYTT